VEEVRESSHLGGDRFAANRVLLPSGTYYGRVRPEEAASLVAAHRAGVIDLDRYRGRSCYPPLVQSAELFARRHLDEPGLDVVSARRVSGDDDAAEVEVRVDGGPTLRVRVVRERADGVLLTCGAAGEGRPWRYRLVAIEG
jgi:hypothetical protein